MKQTLLILCPVMLVTIMAHLPLAAKPPREQRRSAAERNADAYQHPATQPGQVRVGRLIYADDRSTRCFNNAFLAEVDRRSTVNAYRKLINVRLDQEQLFDYPMIVMSGEKPFTLPKHQQQQLARYLQTGGFLLATAGCSNKPWDRSFRKMIQQTLPELQLTAMDTGHPIFKTLYDIDRIVSVKPAKTHLYALTLHGRLVGIYSPVGLNDAFSLGSECCCCGANEIRNARKINANILLYAVTH